MEKRENEQGLDLVGLFSDEHGFTTVGMVLALLITLSLLFASAQVLAVNAAASKTQSVADAAALAAENEVAEFMLAARIADAGVLSLTLASLVSMGLGVVCACIPQASTLADGFLEVSKNLIETRNDFADAASQGLDRVQQALPFLAAVNAASVASENASGGDGASYVAIALLVPFEGKQIEFAQTSGLENVQQQCEDALPELQDEAQAAEDAAQRANQVKQLAFEHDCGAAPSYCMYERASTLAGMRGSSNPLYASSETWSFGVALKRAQSYYALRLQNEVPADGSEEEQARSSLRKRFYRYAVERVDGGYVVETDETFRASFPRLPRNTAQMRETALYTEVAYPISAVEGQPVMHAWNGCSAIEQIEGYGSIAQMESGSYETCPTCGFSASSMGKVAAASSSIENGFEYHYDIVAQAAEDYEAARRQLDPYADQAKSDVESLIGSISDLARELAGQRINPAPPGCYGALALVVAVDGDNPARRFESPLAPVTGSLGSRVALSASTLVEEEGGQAGNVILSFFDGFEFRGGTSSAACRIILRCWSGVLRVYAEGQEALMEGVEHAFDSIPLATQSGLGLWASRALTRALRDWGLEAADLDALKPVLVNTAHVARRGNDSFCATLLSVKRVTVGVSSASSNPVSTLLSLAQQGMSGTLGISGSRIEVARIELFNGTCVIPLELALPLSAQGLGSGLLDSLFSSAGSISAQRSDAEEWR